MIELSFLADRPVAVLGLGRSGAAAARALMASEVPCWAWDDDADARSAAEAAGIPLVDLARSDLRQVASLVLSPGIPHTHPRPHPVVERARAFGCEIIGDCELLFRAHPQATFIGVTGTNGKSTTTALIGHILNAAGRRCEVGGNLGTPALDLAPLGEDGVYVLEMSSYQLELTPSARFDVAVLLNITADHLDRHGGMGGYVAAKRPIFRGQKAGATAVIGGGDPYCRQILGELRADNRVRTIPISGRTRMPGGVFALAGTLHDDTGDAASDIVLDLATAAALPGEHNAENAAAAYAAVRAVGVDRNTACAAIRDFPGLAHRQERIAVVDGVTFVNDSKATNPEAAARALACYDDIYWIVGGRPKLGGLEPLMSYLPRVRHAFLIGEAAAAFAVELTDKVPFTRSETLDSAVAAAHAKAMSNGAAAPVVLLSPACASFDQFANFEARGSAFRSLVEGLAS